MEDLEQWKSIKNFEDYSVSTYGRIKRKTILKPNVKKDRVVIHLSKHNKQYQKTLNRLVVETFLEITYKKYKVCHIDGNKSNNRLVNLKVIKLKSNTINKKYTKIKNIYNVLKKCNIIAEKDEEWNQIEHYDNYLISSHARILNTKTKKLFRQGS